MQQMSVIGKYSCCEMRALEVQSLVLGHWHVISNKSSWKTNEVGKLLSQMMKSSETHIECKWVKAMLTLEENPLKTYNKVCKTMIFCWSFVHNIDWNMSWNEGLESKEHVEQMKQHYCSLNN